jgi:hypothetical protein
MNYSLMVWQTARHSDPGMRWKASETGRRASQELRFQGIANTKRVMIAVK